MTSRNYENDFTVLLANSSISIIFQDQKSYSVILYGVPSKKILPGHSSIPRDIFFFVKKAKTSGRL